MEVRFNEQWKPKQDAKFLSKAENWPLVQTIRVSCQLYEQLTLNLTESAGTPPPLVMEQQRARCGMEKVGDESQGDVAKRSRQSLR